jgi:hypothetical protein
MPTGRLIFVVEGEDVYRPATEQIAAVLDIACAAFAELSPRHTPPPRVPR